MKGGFREATVERAVCDILYFNPKKYLDNFNLIDWSKVKEMSDQIGYNIKIPKIYDDITK